MGVAPQAIPVGGPRHQAIPPLQGPRQVGLEFSVHIQQGRWFDGLRKRGLGASEIGRLGACICRSQWPLAQCDCSLPSHTVNTITLLLLFIGAVYPHVSSAWPPLVHCSLRTSFRRKRRQAAGRVKQYAPPSLLIHNSSKSYSGSKATSHARRPWRTKTKHKGPSPSSSLAPA